MGCRFVPLVLVASACCAAATSAGPTRARAGLSAGVPFPLDHGNRWSYARTGGGVAGTWEVTAAAVSDAAARAPRYMLEGYFPGPPRRIAADRAGTVVEHDASAGADALWYRLGTPVGTSWELRLADLPDPGAAGSCVSGSKVTLAARDETLTVPAGRFQHVIRLDIVPPCADAGLVAEWFAPGVGLIRRVETSFAGEVVSELTHAVVAGRPFPTPAYETSVALEAPLVVNDLMPPVDARPGPALRGVLTLANRTAVPLELAFTGCVSASIRVVAADGGVVLSGRADDGGCCSCDAVQRLVLVHDALLLPFSLGLRDPAGRVVPDGRYGVEITLDVLDPEPLRPSARSRVEVQTVY